MKKAVFIFLVVSLFAFGSVSASFDVGNESHQIQEKYSFGDMIKGWINITLINEPISSLFESSFGTITLMDLLDLNDITPDCIPTDCKTDYATVEGSEKSSDSFNLNTGESVVRGFKFVGDSFGGLTEDPFNNDISDFSITVNSDAGETTKPQLLIDLVNLDDNQPEWGAYVHSGNFYNEDKGCYGSGDLYVGIYDQQPFCGKIVLPASPKIEVGAYIIQDINQPNLDGITSFIFKVLVDEDASLGTCSVSITGPPAGNRTSCVIEVKTLELKEIFVCVQTADDTDNQEYKINSETDNACGYAGNPGSERDFDIFAKAGKYAKVESFILNDTEFLNAGGFIMNIKTEIDDYIYDKYRNVCTNECVVPIRFTSGIENHNIDFSSIRVKYLADNIIQEITNVYNLTTNPAVASLSDYYQLYLDEANFSLPSGFGDHIFSLELGGELVLSEEIVIEKKPQIKSLNRHKVAAAYPTTFIVEVESSDANTSIIKYEWDFGNGDKKTTTENFTIYAYPKIGNFKINITVIDSNLAKDTKSFDINVKVPQEVVDELLGENKENFEKIDSQIKEMPLFYQNSLNNALNLDEVGLILSDLQEKNARTSNTDNDYVEMVNALIDIKIPSSINITERADAFPFYIDQNKIDLDILSEIDESEYTKSKSALYLDAILSWNVNNIQTTVDFKKFSGVFSGGVEEIVNIFEIHINENQNRNSSFFFIPKFEKIIFQKDYGQEEISGYYYIELDGDAKNIDFSTTEKIDIFELPAFISPRIDRFSAAIEFTKEEREKLSRQTLLALSLILVFFLGFIAYLIMQTWYKRKYEKYLFKNRNDLYNLVSYIQNAKKRNIDINEMHSKLRKIGWNSEQIKYVMRKYSGKRTGMLEIIPLDKIFGIFSRNKNPIIHKRNPRFMPTRKFNKLP